jgi:hypothetical protein
MPIVNGDVWIGVTAAQLDEWVFNINFGSVEYKSLQPTTTPLFTNRTVAASGTATSTGVPTGNNAKMQVMFSQTGESTNCTCNIYSTTHDDLSNAGIIATFTIGQGGKPVTQAIDPPSIPAITFAEIINNDPTLSAIATVEITTWKEPDDS